MIMALVFGGLAVLLMIIAAYSLTTTSTDGTLTVIKTLRPSNRRAFLVAMGSLAAIVLVGGTVMYGALGFPPVPGKAGGSPTVVGASSTEALARELQATPSAAGYKRLGNMYFMTGEYEQAVAADHRAIELGADDSGTWSQFGESIVMAADGSVVPQALAAFTNAISRDPRDARARYYIGMAEAQIGNFRQAVAVWRDLENSAEPHAPWLEMVRQHVAAFSKQGGFDPESVPAAAPSPTALRRAVAAMTAAQQNSSQNKGTAPPAELAATATTQGK